MVLDRYRLEIRPPEGAAQFRRLTAMKLQQVERHGDEHRAHLLRRRVDEQSHDRDEWRKRRGNRGGLPAPTWTSAPTMLRIMWWRKALAEKSKRMHSPLASISARASVFTGDFA